IKREVGEEEESHASNFRGSAVELIVLDHHVFEVVIVGDGDKGVEILAGKLVLEGDVGGGGGGIAEGGKLGKHSGEGYGRAVVR
ncbi:hypothetical protein S245_028923, partial [Arachis hypogaea]